MTSEGLMCFYYSIGHVILVNPFWRHFTIVSPFTMEFKDLDLLRFMFDLCHVSGKVALASSVQNHDTY